MSEVHVYGVVPATAKFDPGDGVRLIVHRDVAALVRDLESTQLRAVEVVREQWRVLEAAIEHTTVLPVRFGTVMESEDALVREFLEPSHDDLAATLAQFDGVVQLTVKGSYDEEALMAGIVKRSPAVAQLSEQVRGVSEELSYYERIELGRLVSGEVERERKHDGQAVIERLESHALAAKLEGHSAAESAVNAAFLVERGRIDEFSAAVADLERSLDGRIELRYLGPLPPYSFTGEQAVGAPAWA